MNIESKYDPAKVEESWYKFWLEKDLFKSVPDEREAYTIVIPPPNVTGVLHMGHMLNNTIQDILIRRARMLGKNACWVPGTDHASIATEAKVVNLLAEKGIDKREIGREEFLEHAWEWKEKHDGIIIHVDENGIRVLALNGEVRKIEISNVDTILTYSAAKASVQERR